MRSTWAPGGAAESLRTSVSFTWGGCCSWVCRKRQGLCPGSRPGHPSRLRRGFREPRPFCTFPPAAPCPHGRGGLSSRRSPFRQPEWQFCGRSVPFPLPGWGRPPAGRPDSLTPPPRPSVSGGGHQSQCPPWAQAQGVGRSRVGVSRTALKPLRALTAR